MPENKTLSVIGHAVPLVLIALVTLVNAYHAGLLKELPPYVQEVTTLLWLDQEWGVFAPEPPRFVGWPVIVAELDDGTYIDLRTGNSPVPLSETTPTQGRYPGQRWSRFVFEMIEHQHEQYVEPFMNFLRTNWEHEHSVHITCISLNYMVKPVMKATLPTRYREWKGPCI